MSVGEVDREIVTPAGSANLTTKLIRGQTLPALGARIGAFIARKTGSPFRFGTTVVATRHAHVKEMLCRDLDFGIAAVNAVKIGEVNGGPFILGMDRSAELEEERRALYEALAAVDMSALQKAAEDEISEKLAAVPAGGRIDVVEGYARPVAAHTAQRLFGINPGNDQLFMEVVRSVFAHTFLNLSGDQVVRDRAIKAGRFMGAWYAEEIVRRRASGQLGDDMMGKLLRQGVVNDDGVRRTLGGMLVGSIDTTATCVAKIVKVAARDRELLRSMARDVDDLRRMHGWCEEALRRWPHNPIVMRTAMADTELAGQTVKKGDSVIAWTQAAMQDESAFPDPKRLRPDRDLSTYLHLGWGLHPCSGRVVNRFQIPLLVAGLLRRGPDRVDKMQWTSSFPGKLMVSLKEGPR
ncbi:cytochrome P450 [Allosphingosinicella sp.]|jgi:cytochrome P450|uniref:cytochrome P450 n=1 Tax=Allosphingosinicella sp. TaxID=2823234 RepID=UPI002EF5A7F4